MALRFGDFVFDPVLRELRRKGKRVALRPKAYQLLALLIERRPELLPHAELKKALWPKTRAGHATLTRLVAELRKALRDTAPLPVFVRTVKGQGYAFAAAAVPEAGAEEDRAALVLVTEHGEFPLFGGGTLLGRAPACGVLLDAVGVSRVHAEIRVRDGRAVIQDRQSKNGTWVNGTRIATPVPLHEGDELFMGTCRILVRSVRTAPQ